MLKVSYFENLHELVSLIPIAVGVLWSWYQWKNRRLIHIAKQLPTIEPTVPILGHLHFGLFNLTDFRSYFIVNVLEKAASKNIKQFCIWMGPIPYIFIMDSKDVKVVLTSTKSLERGKEYEFVKFALGEGLLTSKVHIWKHNRKAIQPMFHPRNLEHMLPIINKKAKLLVDRLPEEVRLLNMDVLHKLMNYAVSSVIDLLYGPGVVESDPESQWIKEITDAIVMALNIWAERVVKLWTQWDFLFQVLYKNSISNLKTDKTDKTESGLELLRKNVSIIKEGMFNSYDTDYLTQLTLPQIFAQLNMSNSQINEERFKDEVLTFVGAGADTTSIILSSCLLSLAFYPDIQDQVLEEILVVCGTTDEDVSVQELQKLTLLERVLKETNRRFSVVPISTRKVTEDLQLSFGTIPAGSYINVATYAIHMNSSTYPDPYRFDPDRFLPENVLKRDKFCYIPFSSGPRNCIGKGYAMLTMKIFIVHILRNYKISLAEDITNMDLKFQSTMVRKEGYPIHMKRRKLKDHY